MVAGKRRAAIARCGDALGIVDANIEEHRGHTGIDVLGKILAWGDRRRGPELVAEGRLQNLLGGRDNSGIVDHRLDTLGNLDIRCRRIHHGGDRFGGTFNSIMNLSAHVRFEGSNGAEQDRLVGNDVARGAGMERADGDHAEFGGSFSRLMTLCTSTTKRDAIITGSMVACGTAPWPPRPLNLM